MRSRSFPTRGLTRLLVSLLVVVSLLAAGVGVGGAAADASTTPVAAYADDGGTLTVLYADGTTASLGVTGSISHVGRVADLDGDGRLEAPYVSTDGALRIVDMNGTTRTLTTDADTGKDVIATGDWDGDGRVSVYYEGASDGRLYRVQAGTSPTAVTGPDGGTLATNGVVGVADYDGDGTRDLLFLGSSSTLKYYDGATVETTGFSSFGSNYGLGVGAPADFDGDGVPRVPYVTGSQTLGLLAADGSKTPVDAKQTPAKAPVGHGDWTGDGSPDVLYVGSDDFHLQYASLGGPSGAVSGPDGAPRPVAASVGVATVAPRPAPTVSNFALTNPSARTLSVSFTSDERLERINATISGPDDAVLTRDDFEASGDGPYEYRARTTVDADGDYVATLRAAVDGGGADGADGQTDATRVETSQPSVSNATLTAVNGSPPVGLDGRVRVAATVENASALRSVTADATAFGAGTVALTRTANDTYAATVPVTTNATTGTVTLVVNATNEYDHSGTAATRSLAIDGTRPVADGGPNVTVHADTLVGFDGDASRDAGRIVRYAWRFGDGATATGEVATHTYDAPGTYAATLTVVDAAGNRATDTRTVTVLGASEDTETEVVYVDGGSGGGEGDDGGEADEADTTTAEPTTTATTTSDPPGTVTTTDASGESDAASATDSRADRPVTSRGAERTPTSAPTPIPSGSGPSRGPVGFLGALVALALTPFVRG
ncbi:PKD domain-containing protein (plasmid) [Halarchaeum sp. CBA1220]|uniref:PKD domain-containing protein n=1 Tax=Halarchaeum sp. CBA1220 TaxID=1853682 RepID=UPI000F3A82C0|nr:PKD domain-containing protein [Halarchaeum sp. CBA1220]QLC34944.1 PKD domain-containing protein [Halarchaeum sp. CBA1220]